MHTRWAVKRDSPRSHRRDSTGSQEGWHRGFLGREQNQWGLPVDSMGTSWCLNRGSTDTQ
eukprot:4470068-Alexandrium_andersonii.AAC.1